jgi:mono/diheme cytochrome c family protein
MRCGLCLAMGVAALAACGKGIDHEELAPSGETPLAGTPIEADEQRPGDPDAGYHALVHEGYVGCGIPYSIYSTVFGAAPPAQQLPGREGKNAEMPYVYNVAPGATGVDLVMPNCLTCHATTFQGQIIVGLGDTSTDYTVDQSAQLGLVAALTNDPDEKAEIEKFAERVGTIARFTKPATVGANPAENITAVLIAHRDQKTLAWSADPLLPLPPELVVPVDVPPWWRMSEKHAMFYVAAGRGDHARIMMTASTLCVDEVSTAQAIDAYFPDVAAYIASIEPPKYPGTIDTALAQQGEEVFEKNCSRCHGTYGPDGSYPNLLIALADVGTDAALATGSTHYAEAYVDWYNGSFYGEVSKIEPQEGYVAPPLDGIWITAPYLHNGSVPTLEALLDSQKRPTFFTRSYDSADYDMQALGWPFTPLEAGQDAEVDPQKKRLIYDTTIPGYGNRGHTFGDGLSSADRTALIEYLKTL